MLELQLAHRLVEPPVLRLPLEPLEPVEPRRLG
jgi:hypothetical protein